MIGSLRYRLLMWSALVLIGTVGGFAWFIHLSVLRSLEEELDGELEISAAALDATLRLFSGRGLIEDPAGGFGNGGRDEWAKDDRYPPARPVGMGKGKDSKGKDGKGKDKGDGEFMGNRRPPPMFPPRVWEQLYGELRLPPKSRISPEQYFGVWLADGHLLKGEGLPEGSKFPELEDGGVWFRRNGEYRELQILGPGRSVIMVGTPMEPVKRRLEPIDRNLVLAGLGIIGLGLLGQWWISRQIFKPLRAIAKTASGLSAKSFGGRIDTAKVDLELRDLAGVLNSTFDRLEKAFARQTSFTADASHELRTPLAVLRGQAELALSRPRENREYVKALQVCQTSAERMSDLVERLLMLARADADFPGMAPTLVDMTKLVVEVVAELPEPDSVEVATSRAVVWGDGVLLRQLVQNLVGNALKHGGRSVRVSIRTREGRVILKVRDKGPGIAAGHLDHIFDRFYRIDKARARADGGSGGTGLGLSICREIVLRHGGEINCQSIVGHETLFRVELPAFDESVENRRQSPGGLPPHAQGK